MPHAPFLSSAHYSSWDRHWGPCKGGPFTLQDSEPRLLQVPYARHPRSRPYLPKNDPWCPGSSNGRSWLCSAPGRCATEHRPAEMCCAETVMGTPTPPAGSSQPPPLRPPGPSYSVCAPPPPYTAHSWVPVPSGPPGSFGSLRNQQGGRLVPAPSRFPTAPRVPPSFSRALTRSLRPRLPGWLCHPPSGSSPIPFSEDERRGLALQTFPPRLL